MNLFNKLTVLLLATLLTSASAVASDKSGTHSGGGADKPAASYGYENFKAILKDRKILIQKHSNQVNPIKLERLPT